METKISNYTPPTVSRFYRYDWQYAMDIYKHVSFRIASFVIFLVPFLFEIKSLIQFSLPLNLWLFWFSSVFFIISMVILNFACPRFVREYRDYGEYIKRGHSHRWIVWEFYNNLTSLTGWENIVKETLAKRISINIEKLDDEELLNHFPFFKEESLNTEVRISEPVNIDRDIYMPIQIEGERILLFLREEDVKLDKKEKELFWILYSQAVKEKAIFRFFYWVFIYLSILLSFIPVLHNIFKVIFSS